MWTFSPWWIPSAFVLLALVLKSALSKESMGRGLPAYVLFVAVIGVLSGLCLAIYPDASFREKLLGYLPGILPIFYLFGFLWMTLREKAHFAFARAVVTSSSPVERHSGKALPRA
jgi:hypothetical protein